MKTLHISSLVAPTLSNHHFCVVVGVSCFICVIKAAPLITATLYLCCLSAILPAVVDDRDERLVGKLLACADCYSACVRDGAAAVITVVVPRSSLFSPLRRMTF